MFRRKLPLLIYMLIGLAVFGFAIQMFTNTTSLLTSLFTMLVIGAALYGVVYFFFLRKRTSNEMKKYKKALKQSKLKNKHTQAKSKSSLTRTKISKSQPSLLDKKRNKKTKATHLRVIEGNKHKRKNRAFY